MAALNATVFALQYGNPLYHFANFALPFLAVGAVNSLEPSTQLADPSTGAIQPNADTIYSAGLYNLSQSDVRVTIPNVTDDRYWNFAFYDPFGEEFASIGVPNGGMPGDYLFRRVPDGSPNWGLEEGCDEEDYQGYVNGPTSDGSMLVRVLVKNNGSDLSYAQDILSGFNVTAVPRGSGMSAAEASTPNISNALTLNDTALTTLELLAMLNERNQPFNTTDADYVQWQLKEAGIRDGKYKKPLGVNLTLAYSLFEESINDYLGNEMVNLTNGWATNSPQGLYESEYLDRAVMGKIGYLEQTINQALYPVRGTETMNLTNDESYIYTFNTKPPLQSYGFWSLTLYDGTGTLVENPQDKYTVGDRSNITYSGGELVYSTNGTSSDDGMFQILVQSYDNPPPSNWTNNWLPAPADETFTVMLRLYGPTEDLQNGNWEYPLITKGDAF